MFDINFLVPIYLLCFANRSINCSVSNCAAVHRTANFLCTCLKLSKSQLMANENRPVGPSRISCDSDCLVCAGSERK